MCFPSSITVFSCVGCGPFLSTFPWSYCWTPAGLLLLLHPSLLATSATRLPLFFFLFTSLARHNSMSLCCMKDSMLRCRFLARHVVIIVRVGNLASVMELYITGDLHISQNQPGNHFL
ncbi:hypothetical protein KP509_29G050100 [Ceratopteris richardii]|uniref:Uncharacterized protein n=1 Tax=Ceratopteris richardii TaxID=49495 RepID=A0A8T2R971_CERRI|nr:hypothetical protein KP509_29G050100 [Ceratopteris richardii]